MKIFGIGVSKTGTTSLTTALNIIGYKTTHFPTDPQIHKELFCGQFNLTVMREYDAYVEGIAPWYPQLDEVYPDAKFILTIREKRDWIKSIKHHLRLFNSFERYENNRRAGKRYNAMTSLYHLALFGCVFFNESRFSYAYDMHIKNVKEYFKERPEKLLVMDIVAGEGWEKLCPFLNKPIKETTFPFDNKATYTKYL